MKKNYTRHDLMIAKGCKTVDEINSLPVEDEFHLSDFLTNESIPAHERLYFLLNGCDLTPEDKKRFVEAVIKTFPKKFKDVNRGFTRCVVLLNAMIYNDKSVKNSEITEILEYFK